MTTGNSPTLAVTLPSDTEVVMTRTFNAPRDLVFEAHTKIEHIRRWWGMRSDTMTVCEMDFRPGGAWRYVLRSQDGNEYGFHGVYREIVRPERITWTFVFEPYPDNEAIETVVFTEQNGKTTITATSDYGSKEVRDMVLQSGMEQGAAETYDRLEEYLPELR